MSSDQGLSSQGRKKLTIASTLSFSGFDFLLE